MPRTKNKNTLFSDDDGKELLVSLKSFFVKDPKNLNFLFECKKRRLLRLLEWVLSKDGQRQLFLSKYMPEDPFYAYHHQMLALYHKENFDIFCRRKENSVLIELINPVASKLAPVVHSSIAQLSFFKWGISSGFVQWVMSHQQKLISLRKQKHRLLQSSNPKSAVSHTGSPLERYGIKIRGK